MSKTTCCICEDNYASVVACKACRADPANREWIHQIDRDLHGELTPERWTVTDLERRIARELVFGSGSVRGCAKAVGCSASAVRWFAIRLLSNGRTNQRHSEAETAPSSPTVCTHVWEPRSDLGMSMYSCKTCEQRGRRDVRSGTVKPIEADAAPEPTVALRISDADRFRYRQADMVEEVAD